MSSEFNPGKFEQPDHVKEEAKSARTGFGVLLLFCFTIGQSIQAFSRVPGTAGPFFVIAHMFCIVAQGWYYKAVSTHLGQQDLIDVTVPLLINIIWFIGIVVATFRARFHGMEFMPTQQGVGILYKLMPDFRLYRINACSDMLIGAAVTTGFFLFQSPILGRWYLFTTFAALFTHCWMQWCMRAEERRVNDARRRAQQWSSRLNRR